MANITPFELFPDEYDEWFTKHRAEYELELRAVRALLPGEGLILEVGVGTGRFAVPCGVKFGVEPSSGMASKALERGIRVVLGVAEELPIADRCMNAVLMVTTICFVDSLEKSFREARRVLKVGGDIVVGFVDKESVLGREYLRKKESSRFYGPATFYSASEVLTCLRDIGFGEIAVRQTLLPVVTETAVVPGFGEGSFVVLRGKKIG